MQLVSVIVPAYDSEEFLGRALDSVLSQSHPYWECIIVNDGSSDNTQAVIDDFVKRDSRFRSISLEKNSGSPAEPRNVGVDLARGDWICFLDSDDEWLPEKLREQVLFHDQTGSCWSCCGYVRVALNGRQTVSQPKPTAGFKDLLRLNHLCLSSVMISRDALAPFRFAKLGHEDFELWLRLARTGIEVNGLAMTLVRHYRRANSVSSDKLKALSFYWVIFRTSIGLNPIEAAFVLFRYFCYRFLSVFWAKKQ